MSRSRLSSEGWLRFAFGSASAAALLLSPAASAQEAPAETPPNRPPVVADLSLVINEDEKAKGTLRASDPDGDALRFQILSAASLGEVSLDEEKGSFEYTPRPDVHGEDSFVIEVSDGEQQASATVTVVIRPVNDPPVARDATLTFAEDETASGTFDVSDVEGDRLYFAIARDPRHGTVVITDGVKGAFQYTPRKDFHGEDSFVFEVGDGRLAARGEIRLEIAPVNDPPMVEAAAVRTDEDQAIELSVRASDVEGDPLRFRVLSAPAHGTAEVLDEKLGRFRYTPAQDFHGEDRFTVAASDPEAEGSADVVVSVTPVNDPPVVAPLTLSLEEDGFREASITARDVDGDRLSYRLLRAPRQGEARVDATSGRVSYRPRPDSHGADSFVVEVSDGTVHVPLEVPVEVEPVNDAPVTSDLSLSTAEDTPVEAQVKASDVDGDTLRYTLSQQAAHGEVTLDAQTGALRFVPQQDFFGEDAFIVDVSDGQERASANVRVRVTPVNDPPVLDALVLEGDEDTVLSGALKASDVEGDPLRFRVVTRPRNGDLTLDEASGAVRYTPRKDWHGEDAFVAEVSDGALSARTEVEVRVRPVNDPPVVQDLALKTAEDTSAQGRIRASDIDGDTLRYRLGTPPRMGEVKVDEKTGALVYTPAPDRNGSDAFSVEVSDGKASVVANVEVEVLRVPDPPRVGDTRFSTREDEPVTVRIPASDPDGDKLSFRILSPPKRGEAVLEDASEGRLRYTPHANVNGEDELVVEVSDGRHVVRAPVRFFVEPVNDPPTVKGLTLETDEDQPVSALLEGEDIDGDALVFRVHKPPVKGRVSFDAKEPRRLVFEPALTFRIVKQPQVGSVELRDPSSGEYVFITNGGGSGTVQFEFVVNDGELDSEPAAVHVRIR